MPKTNPYFLPIGIAQTVTIVLQLAVRVLAYSIISAELNHNPTGFRFLFLSG